MEAEARSQTSPAERICRKCGDSFVPTAYDLRASKHICPECKRLAINAYMLEWKHRPEVKVRRKAQRAALHAIARGVLSPGACEVCGAHKVEAHHDDYTKPLSVRWLCRIHHRELHKQLRRQAA